MKSNKWKSILIMAFDLKDPSEIPIISDPFL